ncbi:MAG: helix-hairpin-helix domain-containing protein [Saprospiraceae bacterium]
MSWYRDNIYLRKEDRVHHVNILIILCLFFIIKIYLLFFYEPNLTKVDQGLLEETKKVFVIERDTRKSKKYNKQKSFTSSNKYKTEYQKGNSNQKSWEKKNTQKQKVKKTQTYSLFQFDPNKISQDSMLLLGISKYAASNILKYRAKGGKLTAEKLKSIYGIDEVTINRITPYIDIKKNKPTKTYTNNSETNKQYQQKKYKNKYTRKTPSIIEINTADTTVWKSLPGIGKTYSKMIVNFRSKLGGFFHVDQVSECYGIPDSVFVKIKPFLVIDTSKIKKRNINEMNSDALKSHPYVNWRKANHIVKYRDMHGNYATMNDLYKLHGLSKKYIDTLKIYFDVNEK